MVMKTRMIVTSVVIRGDHKPDQGPIKDNENAFKEYCNLGKENRGSKVPMNRK